MVHGYKAFNADWTCRGKQYEVGKIYTEEGELVICEHGMHFCERIADCFNYYVYDPNSTKVAEVIAHGNVLLDDDKIKSCTDVLEVVRELPWDEVIKLCNSGDWNSGNCNSGDWNSGNRNSGNCNSGNRNSGNCNSGNWNSGNCNSGDWNSGNCNSGDWNSGTRNSGNRNSGNWNSGNCNSGDWNSGTRNSGNRNSGDWNSGDWNSGNWNSGNRNSGNCNSGNWNSGNWNSGDWNSGTRNSGNCNSGNWNSGNWNSGDWNNTNNSSGVFNTETENIRMFNKRSDWTFADWRSSDANYILRQMPQKETVEWIDSSDMTDEEKAEHPAHETTGGYLKVYTPVQTAQMWWDDLDADDKATVMALPNFDADVFEKCTGIRV